GLSSTSTSRQSPQTGRLGRSRIHRNVTGLVAQTMPVSCGNSLNFAAFLPLLPVPRSFGGPAAGSPSIGRGEIVDGLAGIGIVDRRAIDLDHLGYLGLPEGFPVLHRWLGIDVVGRMAGRAVVPDHVEIGARFEGGDLVRILVTDGSGADGANAGPESEREEN